MRQGGKQAHFISSPKPNTLVSRHQHVREFAEQHPGAAVKDAPEESVHAPTRDYLLMDASRSAAQTFTGPQIMISAIAILCLIIAFAVFPRPTYSVTIGLLTAFYLAVVLFRIRILAGLDDLPSAQCVRYPKLRSAEAFSKANMAADYLILVPLYRETHQIPNLINALSALRWKGNKTVCLLCETHDAATIGAVKAHLPDRDFELLVVPSGPPQTKPRALNYALHGRDADFVVIYDAEDRPHPDQLWEAAEIFAASPESVACLQAPLVIDNAAAGILPRLFSLEYTTLFKGILPCLCRWDAPVPLGGTSNHFRFDALKQVGGWDSYNVTEDADLGMRLARAGFRCGMLSCPTFEEAPDRFASWLMQRTRWTKGWLQTLLVHFRKPLQLYRDLGLRKFFLFQFVLTSLVVSMLIHPVFLVVIGYHATQFFSGIEFGSSEALIVGISVFNLVAGYLGYCLLAFAVEDRLEPREYARGRLLGWVSLMPLYWLLISVAGWRAVWQLLSAPSYWEKTEHHGRARENLLDQV